jgi:phage gp29-like protein
MAILDQNGNSIDKGVLREPQSVRVAQLVNGYLPSTMEGLTPTAIASALRQADAGNLLAQSTLFAHMEDRSPHLRCEIGKRANALLGLDWDIAPPRNPTAAEKAAAEWLKEVLTDAVDPIEDLMLHMQEAPGHGFAAVEYEWRRESSEWLPTFHMRPQEWFQLDATRSTLNLRTGQGSHGSPLQPFGWLLHTHGKPKTGYMGRLGLYRCCSWPFMFANYSIGDLAEFLETYGLPLIMGKYYSGASDEEQESLMRAVQDLGHDARAVMPQDMQIEISKITGSGDATPHLAMVSWAEGAISKAILGQVLSAEAKATGMGSGLAKLHNEVRHDIRNADARQVAGTITRDLLYPLLQLNRSGAVTSLSRCPRMVFDTGESADITAFAKALPELVGVGMHIPRDWAHEKLRIPVADDKEPALQIARPDLVVPPDMRQRSPAPTAAASRIVAAAVEAAPSIPEQTAVDDALNALPPEVLQGAMDKMLAPVFAALDSADSYEGGMAALSALYPQMDAAALESLLARAMFAAEVWGAAHGDS